MGETIQFTTEGKILFNNGLIVFACDCCGESECQWCNEGYGVAGETVRVTFGFTPTAGSGEPECANCAAYGSTAYDLTKVDPVDSKCRWQGPGECGHIITYEHTTGIDGSFLLLTIKSSDESVTYASWRYETSFGSAFFFNCNEDSLPQSDGTMIFNADYGASPANWIANRPCEGSGTATVDYLF